MRLKENSSSWRARGIIRKDFRRVRNGPEVARGGAKKDTERWCRGRVGRDHIFELPNYSDFGNQQTQSFTVQCQRCELWFNLTRKGVLFEEGDPRFGRFSSYFNTYMYDGAFKVSKTLQYEKAELRRKAYQEFNQQLAKKQKAQSSKD